jgi:hypothetical protein
MWPGEAGRGLAPFSEILIKDLLLIPKKVPVPVVWLLLIPKKVPVPVV